MDFRHANSKRAVLRFAGVVFAVWSSAVTASADETLGAAGADSAPLLRVDGSFPNGSGDVEGIDQQARRIRLLPTAHKGRGWVCWWYIKVAGIRPGETISLDVGKAPWATPARAAFSLDCKQWQHTAPGEFAGDRAVYRQQVSTDVAWFAWGPPFTTSDSEALVAWATETIPDAETFELCRTREGRSVWALRIGAREPESAGYGVWVQARQHAWEAGSSWVCRGLIEWLASQDPRAVALRTQAQLTIVPIMDVDNVALGAGGKNQQPRDHNRDWSDNPHWPAVTACMQRIRASDKQHRFDVFVDLHNPGPGSRRPFFFVTPPGLLTDIGRRNLTRLVAATRADMTGPLVFTGETRESGPAYDKQWRQISKNWVSLNTREHVVSVTLETAWNSPHSTVSGYLRVGQQLGLAIERYLRTNPRDE